VSEDVPGPHPHTKLHLFGIQNVGLQTRKSLKLVIFGINLPLSDFYCMSRVSIVMHII